MALSSRGEELMRRCAALDEVAPVPPPSPRVSLDRLDLIALPEPRPLPAQSVVRPAEREEEPTVVAQMLEELVPLALGKLEEILREPVDFDNAKLMNIQVNAAHQVLTTQLKVDEGHLKRRKNDTLSKLLDVIAREESKGGLTTVLAAELAA